MARKPKTEPKDEKQAAVAVLKNFYLSLLKKCAAAKAVMDEERASLGGMISDAVEKHRLHKGAFGWARKMDKMDPVKRGEWLFHFDTMRKYSAWDVPDMLPDRQAGGDAAEYETEEQQAAEPETEHDNGASRLAGLGDNVQDLRPRHLRSGSSDPDPALKH